MKTFLLAGLTLAIVSSGARAETARQLLDRAKAVNDAREPKDSSQKTKMTLFDSRGGQRVRDLEIYGKNSGARSRRSITFFLSPPEVKGVGFLAWSYPDKDDDQWLYLPELKRVRQIGGSSRKQSFQGSDFSYDDLALFEDIRDWTETEATSKMLRERENENGVPCAVIELEPHRHDYEYSRFVLWLDPAAAMFRKIEFYGASDGALLKTLTLSEWKTIDGIPTAHHAEMVNHKKGTKTLVDTSDVRYNRGLGDDAFSERALERGSVE